MAQAYYNGAQGWFRIWDAAGRTSSSTASTDTSWASCSGPPTARAAWASTGAPTRTTSRATTSWTSWAARAPTSTPATRTRTTRFLKATWDAGRARLWADAQVRHARFEYHGDQPLGSVSWTFFNPKAGVRFDPSPSVGALRLRRPDEPRAGAQRHAVRRGQRRRCPTTCARSSPSGWWTPRPGVEVRRGGFVGAGQRLRDGVRQRDRAHRRAQSEIGLPVRRNAGRSHRRGVELDLAWTPVDALAARRDRGASAGTASRSGRSTTTSTTRTGRGSTACRVVAPRTSRRCSRRPPPQRRPSSGARRATLGCSLGGRWVDEAQLDNTGNPASARRPSSASTLQASAHARALGEAGRAAAPRAGHEPAGRRPAVAGRLQLPLLRPRRGRRDTLEGTRLLLPARHAQRVRHARPPVLRWRRALDPLEVAGVVFGVARRPRDPREPVVLALRHRATPPSSSSSSRTPALRRAGLQAVYVAVSVYGWYEWLHGGAGDGRLAVSRRRGGGLVASPSPAVAASVGLGLFLRHRTDAALPFPDAATTAFSLVAQWMATRKWLENWLVWIAVDVVYVGDVRLAAALPDGRPLRRVPRPRVRRPPRVARVDGGARRRAEAAA